MKVLIYILTTISVVLMLYGILQIQLQRMKDEYSRMERRLFFIRLLEPLIQIFAYYILRYMDPGKINKKYKRRLLISGNPLGMLPIEFLAFKYVVALMACTTGVYLHFTTDINFLFTAILTIGGYLYPNFWLNERISRRKQDMFKSLPYCMDLLKLSVDAGMSFKAAVAKVVERGPRGPLKEEMEKMLQDMRLGKLQRDCLMSLAERTDMYEIRSFVSAMIMAENLGSPISETLDIQSDIRRNDRYQKVEKAGNEAPIKMLFPLMLFILPSVFIVILTPIYLKFRAEGM